MSIQPVQFQEKHYYAKKSDFHCVRFIWIPQIGAIGALHTRFSNSFRLADRLSRVSSYR